jgi:hypothetical protein
LKGRTRIWLVVIAGLLALAGLALLLAAALAPVETIRLHATLAPTLLAPPLGVTP